MRRATLASCGSRHCVTPKCASTISDSAGSVNNGCSLEPRSIGPWSRSPRAALQWRVLRSAARRDETTELAPPRSRRRSTSRTRSLRPARPRGSHHRARSPRERSGLTGQPSPRPIGDVPTRRPRTTRCDPVRRTRSRGRERPRDRTAGPAATATAGGAQGADPSRDSRDADARRGSRVGPRPTRAPCRRP